MKKTLRMVCMALVAATSLMGFAQEKLDLIPYPSQLEVTKEGAKLALSGLNAIACPNEATQEMASEFATMLGKASGITLTVKEGGDAPVAGELWLAADSALADEAYTLKVTEQGVEIKASSDAGFFYAFQTLKQLLPRALFGHEEKNPEWGIPYVTIADKPQFEHRGFMMDVSRHFFDKDEVKKVLDIMALYKMNRFHWHLTDDQGWRIEIPEYPLLTEVGSIRSASYTFRGPFFDDTEYGRGMWFSQDDLREIVAYAAERNIDILPEIDLPGHMMAAIAAYPEFSCDPTKKYAVRTTYGISDDVLNVGDDRVIEFLQCVLGHVAEIFPFPYIHIGGDECPTTKWKTNEDCLRRVKEEGLSGVEELQSWLVEEIGTYLKEEYGKDLVVWDELLTYWNNNNKVKPVIMAWNSINKSSEAADKGFKSIVVPTSHLYLDYMQIGPDKTVIDEPYFGGWSDTGTNTLEEVYALNPVGALAGREQYCWGVQGNLWAESLNNDIELEYQLLPRMLALAETGWLPASKKSWDSFHSRLQTHDEILDALGYTYAKHYIEQPVLSTDERIVKEAKSVLEASVRGGVGYPAEELHEALEAAVESGEVSAMAEALAAYKKADIKQPEAGKTYQIISAATYYKLQFAGSTMYASESSARIHYTPQNEPEELWTFESREGGYALRSLYSGCTISMPTYNAAVKVGEEETLVRVDKTEVATSTYSFIPGVVTISAVEGYSPAATENVKRLHAEISGYVNAYDNPALCYPGTWYIVEVSDFTAMLQALYDKCQIIAEEATPDEIGQPTPETLEFLVSNIIEPAKEVLAEGNVSESTYKAYVELYRQFMQMPRTTYANTLREDVYYRIRNAYFTDYYAMCSTDGNVMPRTIGTRKGYYWSFVKNADGTVRIYNKQNGKPAYIRKDAIDQRVYTGKEYNWTLVEAQTDLGGVGIAIIGAEGVSAWYTNPSSFTYIITKPSTYGASIWTFEETEDKVDTSIDIMEVVDDADEPIYDLYGRRIETPATTGIYIVDGKKIVMNK